MAGGAARCMCCVFRVVSGALLGVGLATATILLFIGTGLHINPYLTLIPSRRICTQLSTLGCGPALRIPDRLCYSCGARYDAMIRPLCLYSDGT